MEPIPPSVIPPQPSISSTPFVSPEPPKKKSLAWLIIMVVLFLLASTGVLAYQYYQLKTQVASPAANPSLVPSPTPTPSQDPTANWKIYINSRQHYQTNYPSNWTISENTLPAEPVKGNKIIQDLVTIDNNGETPRVEIDSGNQLGLTTSQVKIKKSSQFKIDNLDTYYDTSMDEGGGTFTNYYFIKNSKIYTISTIVYPKDSDSNVELTLNQILSTFKFLD